MKWRAGKRADGERVAMGKGRNDSRGVLARSTGVGDDSQESGMEWRWVAQACGSIPSRGKERPSTGTTHATLTTTHHAALHDDDGDQLPHRRPHVRQQLVQHPQRVRTVVQRARRVEVVVLLLLLLLVPQGVCSPVDAWPCTWTCTEENSTPPVLWLSADCGSVKLSRSSGGKHSYAFGLNRGPPNASPSTPVPHIGAARPCIEQPRTLFGGGRGCPGSSPIPSVSPIASTSVKCAPSFRSTHTGLTRPERL